VEPAVFAAFDTDAIFDVVRGSAFEVVVERLNDPIAIVGMDTIGPSGVRCVKFIKLMELITEQLGVSWRKVGRAVAEVAIPDAVATAAHGEGESILDLDPVLDSGWGVGECLHG
jgi:hypothetical protein